MKATALNIEAATASALKKAVKDGYVLLTRAGKPVAYILPAAYYDEEDIGYMTDPEFWRMIEERRKEDHSISLEVLQAEVAQRERLDSRKSTPHRMRTGRKKAG